MIFKAALESLVFVVVVVVFFVGNIETNTKETKNAEVRKSRKNVRQYLAFVLYLFIKLFSTKLWRYILSQVSEMKTHSETKSSFWNAGAKKALCQSL